MNLTLCDYADLIIANVYGGLKGVANFSISKEAVEAEFVLGSRRLIKELQSAQRLDPEEFFQVLPKVKLSLLTELSDVPLPDVPDKKQGKIFYMDIPELLWSSGVNPVDYIGPFNRFYQYIVKKGNSFIEQRYSKYHAKEPAVWIKGKRAYVMNNLPNVQFLQLRVLLKDPTDLLKEGDPFPIPSDAGDILVQKMSEQYIRYYRLQTPQPNTQNDIPRPAEQ